MVLVDGTNPLHYIFRSTQQCNTLWCLMLKERIDHLKPLVVEKKIRKPKKSLSFAEGLYCNTFSILICIIIHRFILLSIFSYSHIIFLRSIYTAMSVVMYYILIFNLYYNTLTYTL